MKISCRNVLHSIQPDLCHFLLADIISYFYDFLLAHIISDFYVVLLLYIFGAARKHLNSLAIPYDFRAWTTEFGRHEDTIHVVLVAMDQFPFEH